MYYKQNMIYVVIQKIELKCQWSQSPPFFLLFLSFLSTWKELSSLSKTTNNSKFMFNNAGQFKCLRIKITSRVFEKFLSNNLTALN